jgi:hypothetical protein
MCVQYYEDTNFMLGHEPYKVLVPAFDVIGAIRGDYSGISRI